MSTNRQQINPLICIPSPRNIQVVKEALDEIKDYDKLWMKENFNELEAYQVLRNYFLENKEYTHLVIMPDDLFLNLDAFYKLIHDLQKRDYPVLSGICNLTCEKFNSYNTDIVVDYNHQAGREWLMMNEIPNVEHYPQTDKHKGIKKVAFAGFPLTFIRRDIVEKIPFNSRGLGIDSHFSVDCLREKVDQYVDFDARSIHLKDIENCEDIGELMGFQFAESITTNVNTKKKVTPRLIFEGKDNTRKEIDISNYLNK